MDVKPKILLLTDDTKCAESLAGGLASRGFEVAACVDEKQLKEVLAGAKFNAAVTCAVAAPERGARLVKALRRRRKLLPIVAVTDEDAEGEKSELLAAGADSVAPMSASLEPLAGTLGFYCSMSKGIQTHIGEDKELTDDPPQAD